MLKDLLDQGVAPVGDATQCHAVAIDARAPKFDGGIVTRLDCVPFSIVVDRDGQRFYDEGEDVWPKRYAIWGRLVAQQPGQIAYSIIDSKSETLFMPSVFPAIRADSIGELARQARPRSRDAGSDGARLQRRGAARRFRQHAARRLPHRRARSAEDELGAADRHAALHRLSAAPRHHLHLSRRARGRERARADGGRHARRPTCSPRARSWPATSSARAISPGSACRSARCSAASRAGRRRAMPATDMPMRTTARDL